MFCVEKKKPLQIARAHRGKLGSKMFFVKRVWSNSSVDERQRLRNQDGLAGRQPKVRNQPEAPWWRNGNAADARHGSPSLGERLFYITALLLCNPRRDRLLSFRRAECLLSIQSLWRTRTAHARKMCLLAFVNYAKSSLMAPKAFKEFDKN